MHSRTDIVDWVERMNTLERRRLTRALAKVRRIRAILYRDLPYDTGLPEYSATFKAWKDAEMILQFAYEQLVEEREAILP